MPASLWLMRPRSCRRTDFAPSSCGSAIRRSTKTSRRACGQKRIPDGIALMVDYNQALGADEALKRGRASTARTSRGWRADPHD